MQKPQAKIESAQSFFLTAGLEHAVHGHISHTLYEIEETTYKKSDVRGLSGSSRTFPITNTIASMFGC